LRGERKNLLPPPERFLLDKFYEPEIEEVIEIDALIGLVLR
jgi:hypothetical protein